MDAYFRGSHMHPMLAVSTEFPSSTWWIMMALVTNVILLNSSFIYRSGREEMCWAVRTALEVCSAPSLWITLAAVSGWRLQVFKMGLRKYTAFRMTSSPYPISPPALSGVITDCFCWTARGPKVNSWDETTGIQPVNIEGAPTMVRSSMPCRDPARILTPSRSPSALLQSLQTSNSL